MDQDAIEELFERNADMRLLELRHSDTGMTSSAVRRTGGNFGAESIVSGTAEAAFDDVPRMRVAISAAPATGVIPGAIVGIAIDVYNDGSAPAPESNLMIALPHDSEFRFGTLRIDGREPAAPEALFANGLPIARLPGESATKVTFQIGVLAGLGSLYLQPRLQAEGVPVVGTAGIAIKRGPVGSTALAGPPATPFYEYDADEEAADLATSDVAEPVLPPVLPKAPEAAIAAPAPATPEPMAVVAEPIPEPLADAPMAPAQPERRDVDEMPLAENRLSGPTEVETVAPEPPANPVLVSVPPPAAPAPAVALADERMSRFRSIGVAEISLLKRLFAAPVPGIIAHYLAISTIACMEPDAGPDASGFEAFIRADLEALGRALVLSRLGKPLSYRFEQSQLDKLDLVWKPGIAPASPSIRLRRDLRKAEAAAISGLLQRSERDATLRLRIALLAMAGASLDGVDNATATEEISAALATYRSAVLAWLVPLSIQSATSPSFAIPEPPAAVDVAGRRLATALDAAVTA